MKYNNKMILSALFCSLMLSTTACSDDNTPQPDEQAPVISVEGDVHALTTTASRTFDLTPSGISFSTKDNMSPRTVRIDRSTKYQEIDGFGAAITGSTAYNLLKMEPEARTTFLKKTFSTTEGYGMSYIRICIGCSDFSLSEYTCCDTEGIENFALTSEETQYVIPVLKEILAINPDIKIMGSPWTAPLWMKVSDLSTLSPCNSWTGGYLNPAHYGDYAQYFVKWIKAFADNGIRIHAVTLQNEPLNRGNSASMFMGWQQQRDFVKVVGPAFEQAGITTKIYAFDHNYNYDNMADQDKYPCKIYADAEASKYLAGAAYHNYGGSPDELNAVHSAFPDKELIFTESTAGDWNDGSNFAGRFIADAQDITLGTVSRWSRGAIIWNLMLDAQRGPNRPGGCTNGFGAVDIDKNYSHIRYNSFYHNMAHMSAVIAPGAHRVASSGYTANGLMYEAFENPDGTLAAVICNADAEAVNLTLDDGTHHFLVPVPGRSVVSLKW